MDEDTVGLWWKLHNANFNRLSPTRASVTDSQTDGR